MRAKYLLIATLFVTAFVAVLVLNAANSVPGGTILLSKSQSEEQDVQTRPTQVKTQVGSLSSSTAIPTSSIEKPIQDGPSLLQAHCTQCHEVQWLQQVKKTRIEWEKALSKMERFNVKISEAEKTVLLDYLAIADEHKK